MSSLAAVWNQLVARVRLAWIKYWTLQGKGRFNVTAISFRRALAMFVAGVVATYFLIGIPFFGYWVYVKKDTGWQLAVASSIYPFPVATVGSEIILLRPYYDRLRYIEHFNRQTGQNVPTGDDLRNQVITKLIDEAVTRTWANRAGITVSRDDINSAYNDIVRDKGSEGDVKTVLSKLYNLTDAEFKRLIPDLLYRQKVEATILERVRVRHILLTSEAAATKVKGETTPDNFAEKAKQYSEDKTTRDTGGDLGYFDHESAKKLDAELEKSFFSLASGTVTGPVKSNYGYHLLLLVEKSGSEPLSFSGWLNARRSETKIYRFLR